MACATQTIELVGTVVSCTTRFESKVSRAFMTDMVANWVVTIDVESAGALAPAAAGERASFLFHSPTHLFFAEATTVAGWRCRFTIDRTVEDGQTRWSNLTARRIE